MHLKHPDPRRRSYPAMAARNVCVRFVREQRGADVSRRLGALNRNARVTDRRTIMPVNEIAAGAADFHDELVAGSLRGRTEVRPLGHMGTSPN